MIDDAEDDDNIVYYYGLDNEYHAARFDDFGAMTAIDIDSGKKVRITMHCGEWDEF